MPDDNPQVPASESSQRRARKRAAQRARKAERDGAITSGQYGGIKKASKKSKKRKGASSSLSTSLYGSDPFSNRPLWYRRTSDLCKSNHNLEPRPEDFDEDISDLSENERHYECKCGDDAEECTYGHDWTHDGELNMLEDQADGREFFEWKRARAKRKLELGPERIAELQEKRKLQSQDKPQLPKVEANAKAQEQKTKQPESEPKAVFKRTDELTPPETTQWEIDEYNHAMAANEQIHSEARQWQEQLRGQEADTEAGLLPRDPEEEAARSQQGQTEEAMDGAEQEAMDWQIEVEEDSADRTLDALLKEVKVKKLLKKLKAAEKAGEETADLRPLSATGKRCSFSLYSKAYNDLVKQVQKPAVRKIVFCNDAELLQHEDSKDGKSGSSRDWTFSLSQIPAKASSRRVSLGNARVQFLDFGHLRVKVRTRYLFEEGGLPADAPKKIAFAGIRDKN